MKTYQKTIDKQEAKDAFITKRIYEELKGDDFYFKTYPRWSNCDCYCEIKQNNHLIKWNTEIKGVNCDYSTFLLKEEKLQRMSAFTNNSYGLYLIYLNENDKKAYLYNCRKMDWNKIEKKPLYQRVTQYNNNSGYAYYNTYFIPKSSAHYVINYSKYLEEYE